MKVLDYDGLEYYNSLLEERYATINSPALTGTPTAPTPTTNDNSTKIATTAYVQAELADYVTLNDLSTELADYLPLSGGTMTGTTLAGTDNIISRSVDDAMVYIGGASTWQNGAYIELTGKDKSSNPGVFHVRTTDGANNPSLWAYPNGKFTWNNANVLTDATVGTIVSKTSSNVSVGSTSKAVASISLAAGVWVVTGTISYDSIVNGRQFAGLNTSTTMNANTEGTVIHSSNAASSATLALTTTRIFSLSSTTTVNLNGYVNGGTVSTGTNTIRAVRIV